MDRCAYTSPPRRRLAAGQWAGQGQLLPRFRTCAGSRSEALRKAEACLVSRTQAMYNGLGILRNRLPQYTDVLREYVLRPSNWRHS